MVLISPSQGPSISADVRSMERDAIITVAVGKYGSVILIWFRFYFNNYVLHGITNSFTRWQMLALHGASFGSSDLTQGIWHQFGGIFSFVFKVVLPVL